MNNTKNKFIDYREENPEVVDICKKDKQDRIAREMEGLDYLIFCLSEVLIGENAEGTLIDHLEEMLEAHFFSEEKYVHIFLYEDKMRAIIYREEKAEFIRETHILRDSVYKKISCRKYISQDEYGQTYICGMRPERLYR